MNGIFALKTLLTAVMLVCSLLASAETWRFAVIGDTPYSDDERVELPKMLDDIASHGVDFVVHVGDFKNGQSRCDDSVFADRQQLFASSRVPFILVPGDNEWTDCHRQNNGAYQPLERLQRLRQLFWATPQSLGHKKIALEQQSAAYPEHSRFRLGPLLFVTLNVPGSNNNWGLGDSASAEYRQRQPQVAAWVRDSFALARREKLAGVVLMFQANPGFKRFTRGLPFTGYREFLEQLVSESEDFPGRVLAIHGDTHSSRVDQPLRPPAGETVANFTRLESFGYPLMGWTRVIVDSEKPELFRFEQYPWPPR